MLLSAVMRSLNDHEWDKKLNIRTSGKDAYQIGSLYHPYEPTPYRVLQRLAESGYIRKENNVIDYGCGKGRAAFFLHHALGCRVTGLEYDPLIYGRAMENLKRCGGEGKVEFVCGKAEDFEVKDADCFYFFNPFTGKIMEAVLRRIMDSYYENPRRMRLFFYYPDDSYLRLLLTADTAGLTDSIYFLDEIDCRDLYGSKNDRERIMIFETEAPFDPDDR